MRLAKILGLAAVAAVTAMAFVGTASALADHEYIGLCTKAELVLCANPFNEELAGTLLGTQIGTGEFVGGLFTQKCTSGTGKAKITSMAMSEVNNLKIEIASFTFSGCKPCSKVTVSTPIASHLSMTTSLGNDWYLEGPGHAEFSECTFGAKCVFGGKEIKANLEMTETELILNTNGTSLKYESGSGEGLCGANGKWFAKFGLKFTLEKDGKEDTLWPTLLNLT